jgi:DNA-binding response OmpR family regulator
MSKILIVEDEPEMAVGLRDMLELNGCEVLVTGDGEDGIRLAFEESPHLIILDVMLPKVSGLDVCRTLRANGFNHPILLLTARSQEMDKVVGLEIGADDYITKPFSVSELLARVRAHLRREERRGSQFTLRDQYEFGDVRIDFKKYRASKAGRPLELAPREFELLKYLISHRDAIITREELLDHVWGYDSDVLTRTVDNHIAKLRQKIEDTPDDPQYIITHHRLGYRFTA